MSERLLEAFREDVEHATRVPPYELVEAAGRARRRRRHAVVGAVTACVLAVTGILVGTERGRGDPQPAERPDGTSEVTPYPGARMTTLEEGTYDLRPSGDPALPTVRLALPPGWNSWVGPNRFEGMGDRVTDDRSVNEGLLESDPDWLLGMLALDVNWLAQRGCTMTDLAGDNATSLVRALTTVPRLDVISGPERTIRFGHPVVHLRLREHARPDSCTQDVMIQAGYNMSVTFLGRGTTYDAWVVDADGRPLLLWAAWTRGTPRSEVDDLLGILDSIKLHDPE
jgi:hypothetical protein